MNEPKTVEQSLWDELVKAREAIQQAEALPRGTPMLSAILALVKQGVRTNAQAWINHVTRP